MADRPRHEMDDRAAAKPRWNPAMAAAIVGGAAATAGAVWGARALARRNGRDGGDLNAVMEAAVTACEVAPGDPQR